MAMTVNTHEASALMEKVLRAGLVTMLSGSPGTSKSSLVYQLAEKFGLKVIDLRLSQCDPVDLSGFPTINTAKTKSTYIPMTTFPIEGDPIPKGYNGWLLFLDEFNSAPLSVQSAAYKLILDKQVGEFNLHKNVAIVAAGNLATDNAITNRLSTAMQSRLVHLELKINPKHWLEWAATAGIDYRVQAYINYKPDGLMIFDPNHNDKTFANPRTWEFLSSIIKQEIQINHDLLPLLAGCVGEGSARQFYGFVQVFDDLPQVEELIKNPLTARIPNEPSALYAVAGLIAHKITEANIDSLVQYTERLPVEFQVISLSGAIKNNPKLIGNALVKQWVSRNASRML
jgi:hypothetical protein